MSLPASEALFHLTAKVIQRSKGRSVVSAAAYRAGDVLHDERQDRTFDYGRKGGIQSAFILAPSGAPEWVYSREALWNRAEAAEKRKDGVLAREVEVSLPRDLPPEMWRPFIETAVMPYLEDGAVCDVAIHVPRASDGHDQPHAHILITLRALDSSTAHGFAVLKNAAIIARFENRSGGKKGDALKAERERWADEINRALRMAGSHRRVDHRSYAARGLDRIAEPHIGEQRARRVRRGGRQQIDRRIEHVVALRRLKKVKEIILLREVAMAPTKQAFSPQRQAVKDRLLRTHIPDLDLSRTGLPADAVYRVLTRGNSLRVAMRDGSWLDYSRKQGRARFWSGPGEQSQAATLAAAIGEVEGVDDVAFEPRQATAARRHRDGRPFPPKRLTEEEADVLVRRWQARGYTDVTGSPDGCWLVLSGRTRLQDTGDRLTVHGRADTDALRALMLKAREDWGGVMEFLPGSSDDFKRRAWLEAMRQGVEVVGYSPPAEARRRWEREQAAQAEAQGARQALSGATEEAVALRRAAGGDARAGRDLPDDLRGFIYGYAARDDGSLSAIAAASVSDLTPELSRLKYYGQAWQNPAGAKGSLESWLDGSGEPPGCPHVAARLQQAVEDGEDRDAAIGSALKALGVVDEDGRLRSAEELKAEMDARLAEALERQREAERAPGARHAHG